MNTGINLCKLKLSVIDLPTATVETGISAELDCKQNSNGIKHLQLTTKLMLLRLLNFLLLYFNELLKLGVEEVITFYLDHFQ